MTITGFLKGAKEKKNNIKSLSKGYKNKRRKYV